MNNIALIIAGAELYSENHPIFGSIIIILGILYLFQDAIDCVIRKY